MKIQSVIIARVRPGQHYDYSTYIMQYDVVFWPYSGYLRSAQPDPTVIVAELLKQHKIIPAELKPGAGRQSTVVQMGLKQIYFGGLANKTIKQFLS